jgi:uncharacterized damage-inducible protein DinB
MNTIEHLRRLFAYSDWANRRIIKPLRKVARNFSSFAR